MGFLNADHFQYADLEGGADFVGRVDAEQLIALFEAAQDGEHLGTVDFVPEKEVEAFPLIQSGLALTLAVDKIARKMERDTVVERLNPSWYRDNNYSDVISGLGSLVLPPAALVAPGVMKTADSQGFVDPAAHFRASIPSYEYERENLRVVVQLPLFKYKSQSE